MKKVLSVVLIGMTASVAQAGEFRATTGVSTGNLSSETPGVEISSDFNEVGFGVVYHFGESGPYIGAAYSQVEISGDDTSGWWSYSSDEESDVGSVLLGYRGGAYGQPQLFVSAAFDQTSYEDGEQGQGWTFSLGMEDTSETGRFEVSLDYSSEDDASIYILGASYMFHIGEHLGVGFAAGVARGDDVLLGRDADTSGYNLGINFEYRLKS